MKWILRFISWYIFMWIAIIPIGWYLIGYYKLNFELVRLLSIIISGIFIFGIIFNHSFRRYIWVQLSFFYDLLVHIDNISERKKIDKLKKKEYAYIKKNNA